MAHRTKRRRTKAQSSNVRPLAAATGETEILVYGDIGESWWSEGVTAKRIAEELRDAPRHHTICVRINSYGGDAFEGVAIYNLLVTDGRKIVTKIDGAAISAASVIAMAGSERLIGENAMLMIHDPWSFAVGNADDMRATAQSLDLIAEALCKTYERRSDKNFDECREMMRAETWLGAEAAVDDGFCTEVFTADDDEPEEAVAKMGPIAAKVAARFRNAPASVAAMARETKHEDPLLAHDVRELAERFSSLATAPAPTKAQARSTSSSAQHEREPNKEKSVNEEEFKAALKAAQDETVKMRAERDEANKSLDAAKAEVKAREEKIAALEADKAALEKQTEALAADRDKHAAEAKAASDKLIDQEIEALVGVKIDASERESFAELAKSNRALFDKMVAQRAPSTVLDKDPAGMGAERLPESINDSGDSGGFLRIVNAAANR